VTTQAKEKKPFQLFNLPLPIFLIITAVTILATYLGVLPVNMTGCFLFMIVLGTILGWIGDHTPIIKDFLGGGAIVCIFGSALLVYFGILPAAKTVDGATVYNMSLPLGNLDLVGGITKFFKGDGAFLDWYIAALITGSILGMNRKLLVKAAARYFPAIFGGLILAFGLCMGIAAIMGYPVVNALLLIALPIMGGGMGAGATPLSKIFESSSSMSAAEALSVMTPAVAIGNAVSIVLAGILVKVIKGKMNGNGSLMKAGSIDPKELEISPEMKAKRDNVSLTNLGIGLLTSGAFFAWGFILAGAWKALGTGITIHAYAWMIITVAICKITNIIPERIEIACYQWFQFIMKNMTNMLLVGIGICYLEISTVISSFSVTYLILCAATCIGAFVGAAVIGRVVGFYPFESGVTAGLCMSNMGGTGDVAVLSAANRMELMPFAQISSRLGGAVILLLASLMLSVLSQFIVV
jgi:Na+/citrate or Na+/malate symporter